MAIVGVGFGRGGVPGGGPGRGGVKLGESDGSEKPGESE
jgi:hypothetical protein